MTKLYLASNSPRRKQLLEQIKLEYEAIPVNINEDWDGDEPATDYVLRMAREKAEAGLRQINPGNNAIVLSADTSVVLDGNILGKAETATDTRHMLNQLNGRQHDVLTAVCLRTDLHEKTILNKNRVQFTPLNKQQIEDYINTGEAIGKAGAYAIQGQAAKFISHIEGSYSGIMGLPIYETMQLINSVSHNNHSSDQQ